MMAHIVAGVIQQTHLTVPLVAPSEHALPAKPVERIVEQILPVFVHQPRTYIDMQASLIPSRLIKPKEFQITVDAVYMRCTWHRRAIGATESVA